MKAKKNTFQATQRIIKRQYVTQTKPGKTSTSGVSGGKMSHGKIRNLHMRTAKPTQPVEHAVLNPKL